MNWLRAELGSAGDGSAVCIDIGHESVPGGLVAAPSRSGKTVLAASIISSMRRHSQGLQVFVFDAKAGSEYPAYLKDMIDIIDIPSNPKKAFNRIEKLHRELHLRFAYKSQHGIASMREAWRLKLEGSGQYQPLLIVVDEFNRLIPKKPSQSSDTEFSKASEALRLLIVDSLKVFASLEVHVLIIAQTGRAAEFSMLDGGQDSFGYCIYGRQKKAMANELGHPELATDVEVGHLKGTFFLEYRNRLLKFRTRADFL